MATQDEKKKVEVELTEDDLDQAAGGKKPDLTINQN